VTRGGARATLALVLAMTATAPAAAAQSLSATEVGMVRGEDVRFEPFAAFPAGALLAKVVGDPAKPGPYVVRVKVPNDVRLMPHIHPEDRIYTVISGVFYIGFGSKFDPDKLRAYGPGSVVVLPRKTPHFHWAQSGEYVTQVTGFGPLGIEYLDASDDPRHQHR
jgi:quercetin dioxygenase-like cupin family protein